MQPKNVNSDNQIIKYDVKHGDTWYGIAEAKYGSSGYRQTMEIVKQMKSLNNVDSLDNNLPDEIIMADTITLKNNKTFSYNDESSVDTSHNSDINPNHVENENFNNKIMNQLNEEKVVLTQQALSEQKEELLKEREMYLEKLNISNTGRMGLVILNPNAYKGKYAHSKEEITAIENLLKKNKNINSETKEELLQAIQKGLFTFGYNTVDNNGNLKDADEITSLTEDDAKLLLKYAYLSQNEKNNEQLLKNELLLRKEYFKNHRVIVPRESITNMNEVLRVKTNETVEDSPRLLKDDVEITPTFSTKSWLTSNSEDWFGIKRWESSYKIYTNLQKAVGKRTHFSTFEDKGVNAKLEGGTTIPDVDRALAEYASHVADYISSSGFCFTGGKHALYSSGVIQNYGEIRDENDVKIGSPRNAVDWFQKRPEKFTQIKYVEDDDGVIRKINASDLYDLPAGYIILLTPDSDEEFDDEVGHFCISNGNGQAYGDHPDNFNWENFAKGEHGSVAVFKLNDRNFRYNSKSQKIEYIGPHTEKIESDIKYSEKKSFLEKSIPARIFEKSLVDNKQAIMQEIGITEEQYNKYCKLAKAIAIVETGAGSSTLGAFKDDLENDVLINKLLTEWRGTLSSGMTQMKVPLYSESEKKHLENLGVGTHDVNNLDQAQFSAIGTIVHIHEIAKDYEKYLSNEDIGAYIDKNELSSEQQEKLKDFKYMLASKFKWQDVLDIKDVLQGNIKFEDASPELKELVNTAKLFVDTHVEKLDFEEYVAARWNGKIRVKSENKTNNSYYDNMLQVYIDRNRAKELNGEEPEIYIGNKSIPSQYSYITAVKYLSDRL